MTIVAAWMRALTGVGPSIASGSQVWSGSCADFATAPPSSPSATRFTAHEPAAPPDHSNAESNESEPVRWMSRKKRERHRRVADGVHDEGLLRGRDRARPLVVEADQQVRAEPDEAPADEQQQQVPGLDEQEHREDEERHVGEVAALLVIAVHVADRVADDERADPGDDQHHEDRERVDEDAQADVEVARREPRPGGRELRALAPAPRPSDREERDRRGNERDATESVAR